MKYSSGISLFELIMVIAIVGLIVAIVTPSLSTFRNRQSVNNTTEDLVSLLNEARNDTLFSKNSTYYSVRIESTRAILFSGGTFDDNNSSNKVITFDSLVTIPNSKVLLNGGVSEINFDRLSGDTSDYGTITIELVSNSALNKTITITKLGTVSSN
jgi:type IV fimbrial biogenesis protein FimT